MSIKILHTSDWHLGQYFHKQKSRNEEHAQFIQWLLKQVKVHHIDAVIIAGDIFDIGAPPSYARKQYAQFISHMHALECQLIILAGNHDSVSMLDESKPLTEHLHVHIISDIDTQDIEKQVIVLKNRQDQAAALVCAIPYLRPQSLISSAAGQSSLVKHQALQEAITEHYQDTFRFAQSMREQIKQPLPIIATGHLTACNIQKTGSERDIYIGTLEAYPAGAFPQADYIALGHIHRPQVVAQQSHIRYCGSPIPLSFDELNHDKQVLIAEFEASQLKQVHEIKVPRFQPMQVMKGTLAAIQNQLESFEFHEKDPRVWLKVEVDLSDSTRAEMMRAIHAWTEQYPIEILQNSVMKQVDAKLTRRAPHEQLQDLKPEDVFEKRLSQEQADTEGKKAQMNRLRTSFKRIVHQIQVESHR